MARIPGWFPHLEQALETLRSFPALVVSRPDIESLLHLSRRDAIRFLHRCGASEKADRLEATPARIIAELDRVRRSALYRSEQARRERLAAQQQEWGRQASARQLLLRLPAADPGPPAASLPPSVRLSRSRLTIDFPDSDPIALLTDLLAVARTARDDPDGFRRAIEDSDGA